MLLNVEIISLASDGSGLGPIIAPAGDYIGKKISVLGTIPGETAEVEIAAEALSDSFPTAQLVSIGTHHPARRAPPCIYVPACGGCSLQHISIQTQRTEKFKMAQTLMLRQAKLEPRSGFTLLGKDLLEFGYRNRIHLHLSITGELGFYRTGTGEVVDIQRCMLAELGINGVLEQIRPFTHALAPRVAAIKIERRASGHCVLLKPRVRNGELNAEIESLKSLGISILHDQQNDSDAGHFAQVNDSANDVLVDYVTTLFAQQNPNFAVTELYAGAGNFTFPIAKAGRKIKGVELDENLTAAGKLRAVELKLTHAVSFVTSSCEKFCKFGKFTELVLLDPPRAGAKIVAETLTPKETQFILYVSCNLATLARDLKILTAKGFILEHIAVLDMFSQTSHIEMIATLRS